MARQNQRKQSRVDAVVRRLACDIVKGHLLPGTRLDETEMARHLNVSRTPVREAFVRLAALGLLESAASRGMVVCSGGADALKHMLEEIEGMAARAMAARHVQLVPCDSSLLCSDLLQGHGNPVMRQIARNLWQPFFDIYQMQSGDTFPSLSADMAVRQSMTKVYQAIAKGDISAAEQLARHHVRDLLAVLLQD